MKRLLTITLLLVSVITSLAQPLQPAAKRFWRAGDYVRVDNLAGTSPETYDARNVSVMAFKGITIRVMIAGASDYYAPAQFLNEAGQPYGATAAEAVSAWGQTSPVISGTGVAGVSSINGKTGALTTVVETTGSYSNPGFILDLNAAKITETTTRRFLSDSKINQYDGYSTQISTALTAANSATATANTALTAAGSVTATVATHTTQISSVSTAASSAITAASSATTAATAAQTTANTAISTANSATTSIGTLATQVSSVTNTANTALNNANTALSAANSATAAAASKAPLVSPAFTGTPTAPTATTNTATDQVATTLYLKNELFRWFKDTLSTYGTPFDSVYFQQITQKGSLVISPIVSAWPSGGGGTGTVDVALNASSSNAVANSAVTNAINANAATITGNTTAIATNSTAINNLIGNTLTPTITSFSTSNATSTSLGISWTYSQISAAPVVQYVADVTALLAAATGATRKLIICASDPAYSSTGPTINLWDGTNLQVIPSVKRN